MFIKQLSIFVENKQGRLGAIVSALAKDGVNIRALSLADTTNFGVLRLIVDDTVKAKKALDSVGVIAKTTDVIAVYVDDCAGALDSMLALLTEGGVEIEYMYAFVSKLCGKALMVVKADDEEKAEKILTEGGMKTADKSEI